MNCLSLDVGAKGLCKCMLNRKRTNTPSPSQANLRYWYDTLEGYLEIFERHTVVMELFRKQRKCGKFNTMIGVTFPLSFLYYLDIIYTCSSVHKSF